ncbi:MAG: amidohydrolase family protein [Streptosporangiales bacterium]
MSWPHAKTRSRTHRHAGVAALGVLALTVAGMPAGPAHATSRRTHGGGQSTTVTLREGSDVLASMAPDGKTIVFGLQGDLWRMPATGGRATRINEPAEDLVRPDFAPDSRRIVAQQYVDNNFHIVTMRTDGSHRKRLTTSQYDDRGPVWSPDGNRMAFGSDRSGNYDIWVLDLTTGKLTQRTHSPKAEYQPTWSPNGKRIAYTVGVEQDAHTIKAMNAAGKVATLVKQPGGQVRSPSWSPDGKKIAYTLQTGNDNRLMIAGVGDDETTGRAVSSGSEDVFGFRPRWLDDHTLLYSSNGHIQRRDVDSGKRSTIPFRARITLHRKAYDFKKHEFGWERSPERVQGILSPTISPNGRRVAFVALNDLWLATPGHRPHRVTHDRYTELDPTWSPKGKYLAYSSDRSGIESIYIRNVATGHERRLTSFDSPKYPADNQYRATWCPTGDKIAFQTGRGFAKPPITYVADVGSGKVRKVDAFSKQFEPGKPTFGPGCDTLAMAALKTAAPRFRQGWNEIKTVNLETGKTRWVDPAPFKNINARSSGDGPVWSRDGKHMAFNREGLLWVMPVDPDGQPTGKPHPITHGNADYIGWVDPSTLSYLSNGTLKTVSIDGSDSHTVPIDLTWRPRPPRGVTIIKAGALWDGTSRHLRKNVYVIVAGARIRAVIAARGARSRHLPAMKHVPNAGSIGRLRSLPGVRFVDASNLTVMPGLIEGHMHREWIPYTGAREGRELLAYGITSTVSLGDPAYRSLESEESVGSGRLVGPRAFTAASHINGSRIYYGFMRTTENEATLRRELARIGALDVDGVKTYVRLPNKFQKQAIKAAHELGVPTFSHYFYPSMAFGQDDMSHLSATQRWEFSHTQSPGGYTYGDVVKLAVASKMAITTTPFGSSTLLNYHPEVVTDPRITTLYTPWQRNELADTYEEVTTTDQSDTREDLRHEERVMHRIQQGGGHVWAGTDEPLVHVGQSLQETLRAEVRYGGFTPYEALRTATVTPARDIGVGDDLGTVERGKMADLIFVRGNPLDDITAAGDVRMVMTAGHIRTRAGLLAPFQSKARHGKP